MENRPIITFVGRTIPADVQEKYEMWHEGAYVPLFLKAPGIREIDTYKIRRKSHDLPGYILIYHGDNLDNMRRRQENNQNVSAIARDVFAGFPTTEHFWRRVYELKRSFRSQGAIIGRMETIVNDGPIILIEGYKIPPSNYSDFETWFVKWASRVYVPLLLSIPGVKACNFFQLLDYISPLWVNDPLIERDMPRYMSITYLDTLESMENFRLNPGHLAYSRNTELEFPALRAVWNAEYQLFSSHKP